MLEPSGAISSSDASQPVDDEVAGLEKLLADKAREASQLSRELTRHRGLLREALERIDTTTSSELAGLRRSRDAAMHRAIEAELARAALAFELDETRAGLQTVPASEAVRELRGLYSRVAQLEETDEAQRARLLLADHDREFARLRVQQLERQLVEENERFELNLLRARGDAEAQLAARPPAAPAHDNSIALRGERDGLRARLIESELALRSAVQGAIEAERPLREALEQLAQVRTEAAELAVLNQARGAQISELGGALGRDQQTVRSLQVQLVAAIEAQQAERRARDADVQSWMDRLHVLDAPQRDTTPDITTNPQHWTHELRAFLGSLREPLLQLEGALADPPHGRAPAALAHADDSPSDTTAPGTQFDVPAAVYDKLRASEGRVAELEAALAARNAETRDATISTLKGELFDTRADAARLSDDLVRERTRRRRIVFTVRALQAASESGEAPGPWIDELIALLNEGVSVPPFTA
jgi:hypothetical protein